jgi:hypothetical protein
MTRVIGRTILEVVLEEVIMLHSKIRHFHPFKSSGKSNPGE